MATRAGVSEGVFQDVFSTVGECYRAAYEEGLERLSRTVAKSAATEQGWLGRVRSGLVALLGYFDDEPSWGCLLVLETPLDGALTFECRQRLHELLAGLLERDGDGGDRRGAGQSVESGAGQPIGSRALFAALSGELVVGGVLSVIRTSMLEDAGRKLVELAPSLMAFIVAPYLGHAAAQAELEGRPSGRGAAAVTELGLGRAQAISRAGELPIRATHRTTLVLRAIAQAPYSNNREIAQAAGLADEGQASKLLARLERQGVVENVGVGAARGEPNAWLLTAEGQRALELLTERFGDRATRGTSRRIRGAR